MRDDQIQLLLTLVGGTVCVILGVVTVLRDWWGWNDPPRENRLLGIRWEDVYLKKHFKKGGYTRRFSHNAFFQICRDRGLTNEEIGDVEILWSPRA